MSKQAVIFKYTLDISHRVQSIRMLGVRPEVVHVAMQGGDLTIWVKIDPDGESLQSDFKVVATGEDWTAAAWKHVGTAITDSGMFVWHILQAVKL